MVRMLEGLGVSRDIEDVYRFVLAEDRWTVASAAGRLGMAEDAVRAALARLRELKLLEPDEANIAGLRLVDPHVGLEALLRAQSAELAARQQDLERSQAAVGRLLREFEDVRPRESGSGTERIPGRQAVNDRIAEATGGARFELVAFQRGPTPAPEHAAVALANTARMHAKGVASRTICEFSRLDRPESATFLRELIAAGDQTRFVDELPMRMLILDRRIAFVPLDPDDSAKGALQTTDKGTVTGLHALFERLWEVASEVPDLRREACTPTPTHAEQEVLRLLAMGLTDEAVARHLELSVRTVRRIVRDLMDRLGARSRFELGFRAAEQGWPK